MTNFGEVNCTEAFCTFKMSHDCNVFCRAFGLQPFIIAKQGLCKLLVSIHEVTHISPQTRLSGSMISVYTTILYMNWNVFILEFANAPSSTQNLPYSVLIIYGVPGSCCFPLWALAVHWETISTSRDGCIKVRKFYIFASDFEDVQEKNLAWVRSVVLGSGGTRKYMSHHVLGSRPLSMAHW
jgi:hypothetical protein